MVELLGSILLLFILHRVIFNIFINISSNHHAIIIYWGGGVIGEKPIPSPAMVKFNFGNLFGNLLHLARQQIAHDAPPNPDVIADFLSDLSNHFRRVPIEGGGGTILEDNQPDEGTQSLHNK